MDIKDLIDSLNRHTRNRFETFLNDQLDSVSFGPPEEAKIAEQILETFIENKKYWFYDTLFSSAVLLAKSQPYPEYLVILNMKVFMAGAISVEDYEEAAKLRDEIRDKSSRYFANMLDLSTSQKS